jgi:hypothetical protein
MPIIPILYSPISWILHFVELGFALREMEIHGGQIRFKENDSDLSHTSLMGIMWTPSTEYLPVLSGTEQPASGPSTGPNSDVRFSHLFMMRLGPV